MNPDWKINLHFHQAPSLSKTWLNEEKQDCFNFTGKNYFDRLEGLSINIVQPKLPDISIEHLHPPALSDLVSWNILANHGGFYSDMDILYVRPMSVLMPTLDSASFAYCFFETWFSIGFLGSKSPCRFYSKVLSLACSKANTLWYESAGCQAIAEAAGSVENKSAVDSLIQGRYPHAFNIPKNVVYPWDFRYLADLFVECHQELPAETLGIHWYGGSAMAQKLNNEVTDENVTEFSNTLCYHANRVWK
jgi:hypothetical protein